MDLAPPASIDPFASASSSKKINIRIQQRNGKKSITTVQGLDDDLDMKRISKAMRKKFNCSVSLEETEDYGTVIQLQGDQREQVLAFLVEQEILTQEEADERVVIHGF